MAIFFCTEKYEKWLVYDSTDNIQLWNIFDQQ